MNAQHASRTAMVASLTRAIHTRSDPQPIHRDPWGDRIVPSAVWAGFYAFARTKNPMLPENADDAMIRAVVSAGLRAGAAYANIVTRSRFAEDVLHQAASRGVRQYVLIGAGFDSYALRAPAADDMVVVEIDHPATQSLKRQCLAQAGIALPASARLVPADLSVEDLSTVLRSSLPYPSEPAVFAWLGVTMYLSAEANTNTLQAIASVSAPGSELVFEYVDRKFFAADAELNESERAILQAVTAMGEPWVCGFDPAGLPGFLASVGHMLLEDLRDIDLVQRYDPDGLNKLSPRGLGRLAHTRVVASSAA